LYINDWYNVTIWWNAKVWSFQSYSTSNNISFLPDTEIIINNGLTLNWTISDWDTTSITINKWSLQWSFSWEIAELNINWTSSNKVTSYNANFNFDQINVLGYLEYRSSSYKLNNTWNLYVSWSWTLYLYWTINW
jgi:hypothetical protein